MNGLPPGWVKTTVGDVFTAVGGGTPDTNIGAYWRGATPWISSADISDRGVISIRRRITSEAIDRSATSLVPADSVIVVTRVGLGKVARASEPMAFSQDCQALLPVSGIDSEFLRLQLSGTAQSLRYQSRGTTISGVTKRQLLDLPLLIPPTAEQDQIVAAVAKQVSRLDTGIAAVQRVRQKLKRLRSAVLGAAVTGMLLEGGKLNAKSGGTLGLPGGWEVKPLKSLSQLENGDRSSNYPSKRYRVAAGIPFINAGHLSGGRVVTDSMDYISRERFDLLTAGKVRDGDLVFCLRGSLGKAALVDGIGFGAIASSLVIIRPSSAVNRLYLLAYLLSPLAQEMIRKFDNGTAQPNLSARDLGRFEVPVPDQDEQARIVETLEAVETTIADLETACDLAMTRTKRLHSAILAAAFLGKLVKQNPGDEPASRLVARVAASRASSDGHKRTRPRKSRTTHSKVL